MKRRLFGLTAVALLGLAPAAAAQRGGSIEAGLLARFNWFDSHTTLDNKGGAGARLGVFFDHNWEFEAQGSYAATAVDGGGQVKYAPLTGRLQYNIWGRSTGWVFGVGYTHHQYTKDIEQAVSGGQGLVGFRFGAGDLFSLRFDVSLDYVPRGLNVGGTGTHANWNPGVQFGISIITGTNPDHDKDGVKDKADKCPGTPQGEPADADGCSASQRDTDGDRVMDNADNCPDSPAGSAVDARGCPPDADGDKVLDASDRCPDTPAGEAVDASGCSASQRDTDGDKVTDNLDKCPGTPADEAVDINGCSASQRDSDGDGVVDSADKCPNTAPGSRVDANGCNVVLFEQGMRALVLEGVTFETGKAALTDSSSVTLDRVAADLKEFERLTIEIGGHTDNTGSRNTNIRLSKARAEAVKAYLVSRGVAAFRMTTKGYGPDVPIADNKTSAGRARNRRVQLKKTST